MDKEGGDIHTSALLHFGSLGRLNPAKPIVSTHGSDPLPGGDLAEPLQSAWCSSTLVPRPTLCLWGSPRPSHTEVIWGIIPIYLFFFFKKKIKLEPNPLRHAEPSAFNLGKDYSQAVIQSQRSKMLWLTTMKPWKFLFG